MTFAGESSTTLAFVGAGVAMFIVIVLCWIAAYVDPAE